MGPANLRSELTDAISRIAARLWPGLLPDDFRFDVSASDNTDFGDLSCQAALRLARILKESPRSIAQAIAGELGDGFPGVSRISVDGPGFINLKLSTEYLASVTMSLSREGLRPFLPDIGRGRRAQVEFVSSNPTGPLTVGHCRQAVLGEAICNLLESTGWEVFREYYFNDAGRQMRLLGESLSARYHHREDDSMIPEGGYRGEYLKGWADDLRAAEGEGLSWELESGTFIDYARDRAMDLIMSDLSLLGIEFDRYFAESELLPDAVEEAIGRLERIEVDGSSLVYSDPDGSGKLWLRLTALGRPEDRVIMRAGGMYTYRMPDIAYHLDKFRRDFDLLVDVFGADHLDTARDVRVALEALLGGNEVDDRMKVIIHQFVTLLRGGEKVKMSTRAGDFVTLRDLVDEVGSADVTRYLFLTRRAEAHMDFDLDLARLQSSENPVYYVQYAHARIAGILRHAEEAGIVAETGLSQRDMTVLDGEYQRELMRLLEQVPMEVGGAAGALEPHRLTEILAGLATGFHRFYQHVRIVDVSDPDRSSLMLTLCGACRNCIGELLGILGVSAPDRM